MQFMQQAEKGGVTDLNVGGTYNMQEKRTEIFWYPSLFV